MDTSAFRRSVSLPGGQRQGYDIAMTRFAPIAIASTVVSLLGLAAPAFAQAPPRQAPASRAEIQLSFSPVVRRAAPAVVNVYGARVEQVRNPFFDDPIFRRFFGDRGGGSGPRREEVARSLGSGVVADRSGLVITNNHVVDGMTEVKIALADRREFEVDIILRDPRTDLAVLKIKAAPQDLAVLDIGDSEVLEVGDIVLAIGNPFGVGQTVTQGIVSALARTQVGVSDYQSFVQTDAAINPGNSGGALVDTNGNLLGINTAIYSRTGGNLGIGFAIPMSTAKTVMEAIISHGQVVRGWIGVEPQDITPELAESFGLGKKTGAIIAGVLKGGPADRAGMRPGDILVSIDDKPVADTTEMLNVIAQLTPGQQIAMTVLRKAQETKLNITVGKRPPPPKNDDADEE